MGITISGAGSGGGASFPAITGTITIKNTGNKQGQTACMSKKSSGAKKRLNYNYREISGQLMRTKKVQGASNVLARAKSKLSTLQRCATSGKYDSSEVANAIAHARKMVECAQLKSRNLKQEEQERKKHNNENVSEERKAKSEVKRRVASKEQEIKQKICIEQLQKVQQEKSKRQEMVQKRRRHRQQEQGKISDADMKYLKKEFEGGRYLSGSSADSGVIMNLSAEAAALNETQIALEAQQQAELEVSVEGAALTGTVGLGAEAQSGMTTTVTGSAAAVQSTASVDISV